MRNITPAGLIRKLFVTSALPQVNRIGKVLKDSYRDAKPVRLAHPQAPLLLPAGLDHVNAVAQSPEPVLSTKNMVYIEESPDFCSRNTTLGIPGTARRQCIKDSKGEDGCELLCCGQGHYELRVVKREQCHCKFVWCCDVKCDWCEPVYQHFYCKTPRPTL